MDRKAPLDDPHGYATSAPEAFRSVSLGGSINRGNGVAS